MAFNFEKTTTSLEKEPKIIKKILCFRHGEKEKTPDRDILAAAAAAYGYASPEEFLKNSGINPDNFISLTLGGVTEIVENAPDLEGYEVSILASPKARAEQTASAYAAEKTDEGYPYSRLDVLEKGDSGMGIDSRLDFEIGKSKTDKAMIEAFKEKNLLGWLIKDSDRVAQENGESETSKNNYRRYSQKIASLLLDHLDPKSESREALLIGSHQTIFESFLAKVIEKTEGIEKRDEFIEALGNMGFGFGEGFEMDILDSGEILIKFEKEAKDDKPGFGFEKKITKDLLEEIAKGE